MPLEKGSKEAEGSPGNGLCVLLPGGSRETEATPPPPKVCGIGEQRGRESVLWDKPWKDGKTLGTRKCLVATVPSAWPNGDAQTIPFE